MDPVPGKLTGQVDLWLSSSAEIFRVPWSCEKVSRTRSGYCLVDSLSHADRTRPLADCADSAMKLMERHPPIQKPSVSLDVGVVKE